MLPYEDTSDFDSHFSDLKRLANHVRVHQVKLDLDEAIPEDERGEDADEHTSWLIYYYGVLFTYCS